MEMVGSGGGGGAPEEEHGRQAPPSPPNMEFAHPLLHISLKYTAISVLEIINMWGTHSFLH